jgi:hypothetical protein
VGMLVRWEGPAIDRCERGTCLNCEVRHPSCVSQITKYKVDT